MGPPLPPEWDQWLQEGARLLAAPRLRRSEQITRGPHDPKFALGDMLVEVPLDYLEPLAAGLGADKTQLRIYREVAAKIPPHSRVATSWTVHRDLRDAPQLLRSGLTVRKAAQLLGKAPIDSRSDKRLTVAEKAAKVRSFLADPAVYAVIESEMANSRQERRDRSKAKVVHAELTAKVKAAEAWRQQERNAKSGAEATAKILIDLLQAAQLVHAVGESLDYLAEPERVLEALTDLAAETSRALMREIDEGLSRHDPNVIVVENEMWQAPPARAAAADSNQGDLSQEGRTAVTDLVD